MLMDELPPLHIVVVPLTDAVGRAFTNKVPLVDVVLPFILVNTARYKYPFMLVVAPVMANVVVVTPL